MLPMQSVSKIRCRSWATLALIGLLVAQWTLTSSAAENYSSEELEFFESRIRPLLVEHCYSCHSPEAKEGAKAGLYLHTRESLRKGGDSGPAIVPGNPDQSLLIQAVRYNSEDLKMPPKGKKLSEQQIADLEHWVQIGAPDPRETTASNLPATDPESDAARQHWAFQPITKPEIPEVSDPGWVQSPIDAFVLARLEEKDMEPADAADKRTLIRRASLDLTGLPPTPQEVERFLNDTSPQAYARVIDQLLASPQYGERWARFWLDVSRYADSKGYVFEEERRYPYAFTYRDYVIESFNEDKPFDQFLIEQLAADLLPEHKPDQLAALGYLTLGRRFLNNQPDIIDDRIDVVSRGMMGLTVTCARCHDHKYDPIPTADYYSLYGVFASTYEPDDKPLLEVDKNSPQYKDYLRELEAREKELREFREKSNEATRQSLRDKAGQYLLAAQEARRLDDDKQENLARERKLDPGVVERWIQALETWEEEQHPAFVPWFELAAIEPENFSTTAKDLLQQWSSSESASHSLNPVVLERLRETSPASLEDVANAYGDAFKEADRVWQEQLQDNPAAESLTSGHLEALREILYSPHGPVHIPEDQLARIFDVPTGQKVRRLQREVDRLQATHPGAPLRAMALLDREEPVEPRIFVRGNSRNPGEKVPRQFLEILSGEEREPFQNGSGRLELARRIASPDNPLTARVIVNRVWMHHFGKAIVRTPSDFGLRADPPTHPALLNYLASYFIENHWSLKKLHRLIMVSNTYQQASDGDPAYRNLDPDNKLLWKMNRRRLDFEGIRDSLLFVSGRIRQQVGGRPVDITEPPFEFRRTLYGFVDRQNLPGLYRAFDFASPDSSSAQRFTTTVPQQALYLMNSPFLVKLAKSFVQRNAFQSSESMEEKIAALYQAAFQRQPSSQELGMARKFLKGESERPTEDLPQPSWKYGYGRFAPHDPSFVEFHPLPHFTGSAWQGGEKLPDPSLGWVRLNDRGGHVGNDQDHAAIRRWTASRPGLLSIQAALKHESDKGDGVRGRIVSSRLGLLGTWQVHNGSVNTTLRNVEVKEGDTINFIADCRANVNYDSFEWAPELELEPARPALVQSVELSPNRWSAQGDFAGPAAQPDPLSPWEKLAQVLLMSNELVFIE